ncbi:MAG: hypothetical protein Q9M29_03270 [Mariprofundaceae bacterium]|nr:hypothetical protein [Mariprofundaceae bacterium]
MNKNHPVNTIFHQRIDFWEHAKEKLRISIIAEEMGNCLLAN